MCYMSKRWYKIPFNIARIFILFFYRKQSAAQNATTTAASSMRKAGVSKPNLIMLTCS